MNPYEACSDRVQDRLAQQRTEAIERGAGRVVTWNEKRGCIEERWDRKGRGPAPDSARITPKRGRAV